MRHKEKIDIRIEVEDTSVLLVFPRRMSDCVIPWEQAMALGQVLEQAAGDVPQGVVPIEPLRWERESGQVKLASDERRKHVCIFFEHTDRLRFCPSAAVLVARAIRQVAQDCLLWRQKRVATIYNKRKEIQKLYNARANTTQIIPER